jgi:nitrate reductase NapD
MLGLRRVHRALSGRRDRHQTLEDGMNISGVLVRVAPDNIVSATEDLERLEGVEVHASNKDGRLVVTVEKPSESELSECVLEMHNLSNVLSVSMIYHHFDDFEDEESES